jgi:type IV secretory pathway VirB6-like protein
MRFLFALALILYCFLLPVEALAKNGSPLYQNHPDSWEEMKKANPNSTFNIHNIGDGLKECINPLKAGNVSPINGMSAEVWEQKYTARFTYCMRMMIDRSLEAILSDVEDYMRPAMVAVIFFASVIFGIKAVGGMFRNPRVETALFVMKIIAVIVMFSNMSAIGSIFMNTADTVLVMIGRGADATFNVARIDPTNGNTSSNPAFTCEASKAVGATDYRQYQWIRVFDWLDCLALKLYDVGNNKEVRTSFIAIASASMFAGTSGPHLTMMFASFFLGLGLFMLRVVSMLVMAYGAIAMLMLVLPIFMLTIFFKVTESYFFNRWLSMVIRNIVQPGVVIGFLYFALAVMDSVIYKGSPGLYYSYQHALTVANLQANQQNIPGIQMVRNPGPNDKVEQVVMPIHKVFNINPHADAGEQAQAMQALFDYKKMIDPIEIPPDIIQGWVRKACKDNTTAELALREYAGWLARRLQGGLGALSKAMNEPDKLVEAINNLEDAGYKDGDKNKLILRACGALRISAGLVDSAIGRNRMEKHLNNKIPTVPVLNLSNVPQTPSELDSKLTQSQIHDKRMSQATITLATVLILAMALFTYTNSIERMAAQITGRLGMGLSINAAGKGRTAIGKTIGNKASQLEKDWQQRANAPNATIADKVGINSTAAQLNQEAQNILLPGGRQ